MLAFVKHLSAVAGPAYIIRLRIGLLTGGGDAPGLNAVIRAAVLCAINRGWEVLGIRHGFNGLLVEGEVEPLTRESVRGIGHMGGTILKTTNRGNPFRLPQKNPDGTITEVDKSDELLESAKRFGIDAIIAIGGDGTLAIAQQFCEKGMKIVAVPKTIDNDVCCTITTFGFDTAVNTAIEAIDKLHTTAESHDRVLVIEVMGRDAGFIALHSGVAASADVVIIPEIPYDIDKVCEKIMDRDRSGRLFSIVVVAEGAVARNDSREGGAADRRKRMRGVAERLAAEINAKTGKECRSLVLGHLQRGGVPTGYDRLLATRFGAAAVRAVEDQKWGEMVALQSPHIVTVPITEVLRELKRVDPHHDIVETAREMGISMGD
jgi:6-phosphofructokinase 1